ncbi:hypothetical protein Pmani_038676 [Petrolisthes manimaculis]|uniref:Uncharacterized protein n=1 Tax=Petrolisthes manimaculis TaxID=1843537 RepID=A0AAE1NDW3_9EUCA|nr:hypothetical protein Pmani_038676 [Petrolisthes manimaculis]
MMRYRTQTPDAVTTPAWQVPIAHPTRIIHLCYPGTAPCKHTGRTATRAVKNNQILNSFGKISGGAGRLAPCTHRLHHRHQQQDTRREAVLRHQLLALASPPPPPPPPLPPPTPSRHPTLTDPSPSSLRFLLYPPQQTPPHHPIPPHSHSSPSLHSSLPSVLLPSPPYLVYRGTERLPLSLPHHHTPPSFHACLTHHSPKNIRYNAIVS